MSTPAKAMTLRDAIVEHFTLDEIRSLTRDLGTSVVLMEPDVIDRDAWAVALIQSCIEQGKLTDLRAVCDQRQPGKADWMNLAVTEPTVEKLAAAPPTVSTTGGAFVTGNVRVERGDFVGRDKITITEEIAYTVTGLPNPYLGLRAYTYDDRDAYAGRQWEVENAVKKLTAPGEQRVLLFVTGTSGSGKSSFTQAGLVPALEKHYALRNISVHKAVFHPGQHPSAALQDALRLLNAVEPQRLPEHSVSVLVVDQFEELFTQSDANERDQLFQWLTDLPTFTQSRLHVIVTIRSDYLEELFALKPMWDIAKQGVELRAMSADALKDAIQHPLQTRSEGNERYRGKRFEPALVDRLAQDAAGDPSLLPLLQVTLEEVWKKGRLVLANYGALTDAIKKRADDVYAFIDYDSPSPNQPRSEEERGQVLATFLDLVKVSLDDDYRHDVRISRPKDTLAVEQQYLVDDLAHARLLSMSTSGKVEIVNIVHESLINSWDRLREGVREQRQTLQQRVRYEQQVKDWQANRKSDGYLLTGVYLAQARELEQAGSVALQATDAREFLRHSIDKAEAEQHRELDEQRRRADEQARFALRLRNIVAVLVIVALIALGAMGIAVVSQNEARSSESAALDARNNAQTESTRAVQQEQIAVAAQGTAEARRSEAETERNRAEKERALALARQLASQAVIAVDQGQDAELSLLLAVEAKSDLYRGGETANVQVDEALRRTVDGAPISVIRLKGANPITTTNADVVSPTAMALSPLGKYLIATTQCSNDCIPYRVIDTDVGIEIAASENKVIAISLDGRILAAIDVIGAVQVIEVLTGKVLATVEPNPNLGSEAVLVDPKAAQLAVISREGQVVLLNLSTSPPTRHILSSKSPAHFMAYSSEGTYLVVIDESGNISVWNAATGSQTVAFDYEVRFESAAFSPDEKWLAGSGSSPSQAGELRLWDVKTGQNIMGWANSGQIKCFAFSHNSTKLMAESEDSHVYVWDMNPPRMLGVFDGGLPGCARTRLEYDPFSPDDQLLFTSIGDGGQNELKLWNITSGSLITSFGPYVGYLTHLRFSGRSDRAALIVESDAMRPSTLYILDTKSGRELAAHQHLGVIYDAEVSPDGTYIVTVSSRDYDLVKPGSAYVWNFNTAELVRTLRHTNSGSIIDVTYDGSGKHLATLGTDNTLRIWDTDPLATRTLNLVAYNPRPASMLQNSIIPISMTVDGMHVQLSDAKTGRLIHDFMHNSDVKSYEVNGDYTRFAASLDNHTAYLWDINSGELLAILPYAYGLGFSSDGHRLTANNGLAGEVSIWDARNGHVIAKIQLQYGFLMGTSMSPDGTRLIIFSGVGFARRGMRAVTFWDVDGQRELNRIDGATIAKFSPDGLRWVTGDMDGAVKILDSGSGAEYATLTNDSEVIDLELNSRNGLLAVAGRDGTVRMWNLGKLEPVAILQHAREIYSIEFSENGRLLFTNDIGSNTQAWLVSLNELSELACNIATRNLSQAEWHEYVGSGETYHATCPDKRESQ